MNRIKYFYISALILFLFSVSAQQQAQWLMKLNQSTGAYSSIDSIPGNPYIDDITTAFNPVTKHYYCVGLLSGNVSRLYTLDVITGSVVSNPFLNLNPNEHLMNLEFNNVNNSLYCVISNGSTVYLKKINPANCTYTTIGTYSLSYTTSFPSTFDQVNQVFIFKSFDYNAKERLYSISAVTGSIISNPLYPSGPGNNDYLGRFFHVTSQNKLYGFCYYNSQNLERLLEINTVTGASVTVGSFTNILAGYMGCYDGFNDRIVFEATDNNFTTKYIYNIAPVNASVTASSVLSMNYFDQGMGLRIDKNNGKAYFTLSTTNPSGLKEVEDKMQRIHVYPNPSKDRIKINYEGIARTVRIQIEDVLGRVILMADGVYGDADLDVGNLPTGVYLLRVIDGMNTYVRKFVKE